VAARSNQRIEIGFDHETRNAELSNADGQFEWIATEVLRRVNRADAGDRHVEPARGHCREPHGDWHDRAWARLVDDLPEVDREIGASSFEMKPRWDRVPSVCDHLEVEVIERQRFVKPILERLPNVAAEG